LNMKKPALVVSARLYVAGAALMVRSGTAAHARLGAPTTAASSGQALTASEFDALLRAHRPLSGPASCADAAVRDGSSRITSLDKFLKPILRAASRPSIAGAERPTRHRALEHRQLLTQRQILERDRPASPAPQRERSKRDDERSQQPPSCPAIDHRVNRG